MVKRALTSKKATTSKKTSSVKKAPVPRKNPAVRVDRASVIDIRPYGDPIREAIAKGDIVEMRRLAMSTHKWLENAEREISEIRDALAELESAVRGVSR
jgi:hypothetical protein